MMDQLAELAVVGFHVALASAHFLALEPELAEVEGDLALLGELVLGARILRNEDPDNADLAGGFHGIHQRVHGQIRDFLAGGIVALVPTHSAPQSAPKPPVSSRICIADVAILVVDGGRAQLLREREPISFPIHDEI